MKRSAVLLPLVFLLLIGCGGGSTSGNQQQVPLPSYTLMVYMVGSDLESQGGAASADLQEMLAAPSATNVNVVVTTGGANKIGWTTVRRHTVKNGVLTTLSDLGPLDMGNPVTLTDFITWAETSFPADHFILVLWNHGSATRGFGFDENTGQMLSVPEIRQALQGAFQATGKILDMIGFDACLMATVEVAHNVAPYAKYLVASEDTEPGHGWDYTPPIQAIVNNRNIDGAAIGKIIADGYKAQAESYASSIRAGGATYNGERSVTLSVVDLSQIPGLIVALDGLANDFIFGMSTQFQRSEWIVIADERRKSEDYGDSSVKGEAFDMVDLGDFARGMQGAYPLETTAISNALARAVVYKISGSARPHSNGLSVFLPYKTFGSASLPGRMTEYAAMDFSTTYKSMLNTYVSLGSQDITPPAFGIISSVGNFFSTSITGSDIAETYAVISQGVPSANQVVILGMDIADRWPGGFGVSYTFTGDWPTLNGQFISPFILDAEGSVYLLDIPVLLNNVPVDLYAILDGTTNQFLILGAWSGIDNGVAEKVFLPIFTGDVITPLFLSCDLTSSACTFIGGPPFTAGSTLDLGITTLPAGNYDLEFFAIDHAQNAGISDVMTVTVASPASGSPVRSAKAITLPRPDQNAPWISAAKIMEIMRRR